MKKLSFAILAIAGALLSAAPALADTVNYTLTTVDPTVGPGGTVTFDAYIVASSTNDPAGDLVYSDSFSSDAGIPINDADFYNDTPIMLYPGDVYSGPLFSVTAASTVNNVSIPDAPGVYNGYFDVVFIDPSGNQFSDDAAFQVTVTPEPASWLLLSTGLAAIVLLRRRLLTSVATPHSISTR